MRPMQFNQVGNPFTSCIQTRWWCVVAEHVTVHGRKPQSESQQLHLPSPSPLVWLVYCIGGVTPTFNVKSSSICIRYRANGGLGSTLKKSHLLFLLSVYPSVCMSVCPSVRPYLRQWLYIVSQSVSLSDSMCGTSPFSSNASSSKKYLILSPLVRKYSSFACFPGCVENNVLGCSSIFISSTNSEHLWRNVSHSDSENREGTTR